MPVLALGCSLATSDAAPLELGGVAAAPVCVVTPEDRSAVAEQAAPTMRIPANASERDPRILDANVFIVDPPIRGRETGQSTREPTTPQLSLVPARVRANRHPCSGDRRNGAIGFSLARVPSLGQGEVDPDAVLAKGLPADGLQHLARCVQLVRRGRSVPREVGAQRSVADRQGIGCRCRPAPRRDS